MSRVGPPVLMQLGCITAAGTAVDWAAVDAAGARIQSRMHSTCIKAGSAPRLGTPAR